jgi:hypothetical protein
MGRNKLKFGLLVVILLALAAQFQNCSGGDSINFSKSNRESLTSLGAEGGNIYDGKPTDGSYCRVFDNVACSTNVSNLQSTLNVDKDGIHLTQDNCASTSTDFLFDDAAVDFTHLASDYIGLSRGIFKKCEPSKPATEMADAYCSSSNMAVVINKNISNQLLDLTLTYQSGAGVRVVKSGVVKNGSSYSSLTKEFDLKITNGISQTSPGHVTVMIDNTAMSADLECRQANPTPTIEVDKDLELSPTWIDTSRLAGYWKLNEVNAREGTVMRDSSQYNITSVLQTGSDGLNKSNSTVPGGALDFDGVDDFFEIIEPADKHLDFGTNSFSYMMWIKKSGNSGKWDMPLWKGGNANTTAGYDIECGSSICKAIICDGTNTVNSAAEVGFAPTGDAFINKWVLLTAVIDRSTQELKTYVDGAFVDKVSTATVGSVTTSRQLLIGGYMGSLFLGAMDDVAIWKGALSDSEILEIYQRTRPKFY